MELYKVVNETYQNEHTGRLSWNEANELLIDLTECFPDDFFSIHPDFWKPRKNRYYNDNAVDGWNDIYPLDE